MMAPHPSIATLSLLQITGMNPKAQASGSAWSPTSTATEKNRSTPLCALSARQNELNTSVCIRSRSNPQTAIHSPDSYTFRQTVDYSSNPREVQPPQMQDQSDQSVQSIPTVPVEVKRLSTIFRMNAMIHMKLWNNVHLSILTWRINFNECPILL